MWSLLADFLNSLPRPLPSLIGLIWPSLRACISNKFSFGIVADGSGYHIWDSHYPKTEKPHTLTVTFSWLKSSSLGLLRHGHFKNQASKDTGKNHFPSASVSFCFKMTFCIQQHKLFFELSEFSLTQSSLDGGSSRWHSVALVCCRGIRKSSPILC